MSKKLSLNQVIEPCSASRPDLCLNQVIAPPFGTTAEQQFILRSFGNELIGDKLDILVNLLLVKYGARPAFLLEGGKFWPIEQYANAIGQVYPEFKQTIEFVDIDGNTARILFHTQPLPAPVANPGSDSTSDTWLAQNLGFQCLGIPDDNEDRMLISYTLLKDNVEVETFYAEICPMLGFDPAVFESKLARFNAVVTMVPGWKVGLNIRQLRGNEKLYWRNRLLDPRPLSFEETKELVDYLEGDGIAFLFDNVEFGSYTIEQLGNNRHWLLFMLALSNVNPLANQAMSKDDWLDIESISKSGRVFNNLAQDPIQQYLEFEQLPKVQEIIARDPGTYYEERASAFNVFLYFIKLLNEN